MTPDSGGGRKTPEQPKEYYRPLLQNAAHSDRHPMYASYGRSGYPATYLSPEATSTSSYIPKAQTQNVAPSARFIQTKQGNLIKSPSIDISAFDVPQLNSVGHSTTTSDDPDLDSALQVQETLLLRCLTCFRKCLRSVVVGCTYS